MRNRLADSGTTLEGTGRNRVVAFLEHEDRHAMGTELTGQMAQSVDLLFHRVANHDQRVDLLRLVFAQRVFEHAFDLRLAADAVHGLHGLVQLGRAGEPGAGVELIELAVIDELQIEANLTLGVLEHLPLNPCRPVQVGRRLAVASSAKISRPRREGAFSPSINAAIALGVGTRCGC